jgi:hypothetical protein
MASKEDRRLDALQPGGLLISRHRRYEESRQRTVFVEGILVSDRGHTRKAMLENTYLASRSIAGRVKISANWPMRRRLCVVFETPQKSAKKMPRRRLLSAGAATLTVSTLPKSVHSMSLEPRHQEHSQSLLAHIGQNRPRGDAWLRSWIGELLHEPEARQVLHGPPEGGKRSFTHAVGGLLVDDGFVVTH